jgi:hypothetical protein
LTATRDRLFSLASAAFVLATAVHLLSVAVPPIGARLYPPSYPAARHIVFIAVDAGFALLFVVRPRWLIVPYVLLTAQVLNGHGRDAWAALSQGTVDWMATVPVLAILPGLWLVVVNWQERRRISGPASHLPGPQEKHSE